MNEEYRHLNTRDVRRMRDSNDVDGLIEALKYWRTPYIQSMAAVFLGQIKDRRAVDPLIRALRDDNKDVRKHTAQALGEIGDLRALEPLIQALKNSKWEVRMAIARALGKLGDERAVDQLIPLLREKDQRDEKGEVLRSAAEALDRLEWKPGNDLDEVYYLMAKGEWGKLAELGAVAVELLLEVLHYGWNYHLRIGAAKALGMIGDQRAVEPLLKIVSEVRGLWEGRYRCEAAEALANIGDERAVVHLRRTMIGGEEYMYAVRLCAARALEKLGWEPQNDVEKAYYLIANDEWDKVVEMGEVAVNTLVKALSEEEDSFLEEEVQLNVVRALFRIGGGRVICALAEALKWIYRSSVYSEAEYALERLQGGIKIREDEEDYVE